jgi:hypothetical protein
MDYLDRRYIGKYGDPFMDRYERHEDESMRQDIETATAGQKKDGNINIINRSSGGGAESKVQYNNINIHIHVNEKMDGKTINKLVEELSTSMGGVGEVKDTKNMLSEFFRSRFG